LIITDKGSDVMEAGPKDFIRKQGVPIIVNNNKIPLAPYQNLAKKLRNIHIFRVPGPTSLGACLNYAVKKTKYNFIAKFDDDDYYAPYYLTDSLQAFQRTNADVIGKQQKEGL
jgi:hypothetical protein